MQSYPPVYPQYIPPAPKRRKLSIILVLAAIGGLIYVGVLIYLAITTGDDLFTPKSNVTLEVVTPDNAPVDAQTLAQIALQITNRAISVGYSQAAFEPSGERQIIGKVPADTADTLIKQIAMIGLLEIVDLGKKPLPEGTLINTDVSHPSLPPGSGDTYHTLLTNGAFESVNMSKDSVGQYQISFGLKEDGKALFAEYSRNNLNNYAAIVVDKKVISAPRIQNPITDGKVQLSGFKIEQANVTTFSMRNRPLPFALKLVPAP